MTSPLPRAAVAAAGLLTVAVVSTGAAVAMTSGSGVQRAAAGSVPDQAPLAPAATAPAATTLPREPSSAARSQHRVPLREPARHRPAGKTRSQAHPGKAHGHRPRAGHGRRTGHHAGAHPAHRGASHGHRRSFAAKAARVMAVARAQRGKPYVWGASGPRAFDCSGYVQWVYRHALDRHLPKYTDTQWAVLEHIKRHELRRGDLVFVGGGRHKTHVGIYAGHWTWWVAPHTGSHVKKQRIWPARHTFARVLRTKH